jgi:D-alanyl-D-alanine carboxypeptidase
MTPKHHNYKDLILNAIIALLVITIGVGGYFFYNTLKELNLTKIDLASTTASLTDSEAKVKDLSNSLETEVYKNTLFSGQINEIAGTVGKLDTLSKTDKELLQKYSKVYFLNENYVPEDFAVVPSDYVYEKGKEIKMHAKALPFLESMMKAANMKGISLKIISAYRSFGDQVSLKGAYLVSYGSGANKFSADQGYSEHQLGTAIDFTTAELGADFSSFEKTDAYKWLLDNAYQYGFTLSYPKGNAFYQY